MCVWAGGGGGGKDVKVLRKDLIVNVYDLRRLFDKIIWNFINCIFMFFLLFRGIELYGIVVRLEINLLRVGLFNKVFVREVLGFEFSV